MSRILGPTDSAFRGNDAALGCRVPRSDGHSVAPDVVRDAVLLLSITQIRHYSNVYPPVLFRRPLRQAAMLLWSKPRMRAASLILTNSSS